MGAGTDGSGGRGQAENDRRHNEGGEDRVGGLTSDLLRLCTTAHTIRIRIRIRPSRLCANASLRAPSLPSRSLATPSLPPPLYTPVAAQRPRSFSSRPIVLYSRFSRADSGQGPAEIPRETLPRGEGGVRFESGENKRGFPVALRPNFKLSPLSGGGGGRGGGSGWQGWNEGQCLHKTAREAGGCRRTSRRGVCYAGCASRAATCPASCRATAQIQLQLSRFLRIRFPSAAQSCAF